MNCDLVHFIDVKGKLGREAGEGRSNHGNGIFINQFSVPWHFL